MAEDKKMLSLSFSSVPVRFANSSTSTYRVWHHCQTHVVPFELGERFEWGRNHRARDSTPVRYVTAIFGGLDVVVYAGISRSEIRCTHRIHVSTARRRKRGLHEDRNDRLTVSSWRARVLTSSPYLIEARWEIRDLGFHFFQRSRWTKERIAE